MRGDRLKQLRVKMGHSQESLAELLGIGNRQIWRYENGQTDPGGETVARIAQALNVTADYLLGLSDDPTSYSQVSITQLSPKERAVVTALRRGETLKAVKMIVGE